jgi:diacylglycerol O-acyltransferase / wax synthase
MVQKHMDRLSAVDATFLHQEDENAHMHIGGVVVLEGPAPGYAEFVAHLESRLDQVPRYRQKLAVPPAQAGRPFWVDDPNFHIEYHVRHSGLPSPGDEDQLLRLCARVFSQQLDRGKPLWEMYLVEGLKGGRWALLSKTHHSLVDGVSGAELLTVLFDLTADYRPVEDAATRWRPNPEPSTVGLLAAGVRDLAGLATGVASRTVGVATTPPQRVVGMAREALEGLGEVAGKLINPAPPTPLNVAIGPHRRYAVVRARLDDYKLVKNAFGGTVNDVVICVVAGAMARWLRGRGIRTEGLVLRAAVPVSIRGGDERGALGNRITLLLAPLPVNIDDPLLRLEAVRQQMDGVKRSKQALGANIIVGLQNFAPPTLLAQSSRLGMSPRMYNLLVTNVPGPQFPVYALGRRLIELFPVAFLAPEHALAIAIMSYDGGVNFGVLGDYDVLFDMDTISRGIDASLRELVRLARKQLGVRSSAAVTVNAAGAGNGRATPRRARSTTKAAGSPKRAPSRTAARRERTPRG